ncbi:hypothetical protein ACSI5N_25205 (plasmid) [Raoultella ornithinolytica]|uniref:hypothetical protein n=1 Tax=Raoultella ornithinolytica TaxID=54291 RepID=UPI00292C2DA2|nr:hypothetical protein [Raoultella ornithinolytica]MDV1094923.1 hypothetical protein [Raoultella ornithinolytica]MDV1122733.1 hypothetical protein [Raoultella ornithinolytica]MDV1893248.1 hypothetical protein [Raoultella ornithinolytica]
MKRLHYFSLAFADDAGRARSITMKTPVKSVTAPLIRDAIQALDMNENVALISACWLGKMTERQYIHGDRSPIGRHVVWGIAALTTLILLPAAYWLHI